jgi:AcrR family transcriptional regulator
MQTRSETTQKQIKAAAIKAFCQSGYEAASVAEICEDAGVSKGAFYHHLPSKQALFLNIMEDWLSGIHQLLFSATNSGKPVPELIKEMGNTMGVIFRSASGQLPMFMEFMVQASRDEIVWSAVIAPYRTYHQQFFSLLEKGKQEGSILRNTDSSHVAHTLISLAVGILLQGVVDPTAADWKQVTNTGIAMILDGITRGET